MQTTSPPDVLHAQAPHGHPGTLRPKLCMVSLVGLQGHCPALHNPWEPRSLTYLPPCLPSRHRLPAVPTVCVPGPAEVGPPGRSTGQPQKQWHLAVSHLQAPGQVDASA